jgi:hypothetical protein
VTTACWAACSAATVASSAACWATTVCWAVCSAAKVVCSAALGDGACSAVCSAAVTVASWAAYSVATGGGDGGLLGGVLGNDGLLGGVLGGDGGCSVACWVTTALLGGVLGGLTGGDAGGLGRRCLGNDGLAGRRTRRRDRWRCSVGLLGGVLGDDGLLGGVLGGVTGGGSVVCSGVLGTTASWAASSAA